MQDLVPVTGISNASQNECYRNLCLLLEFTNDEQRLWWYSTAPMFAEMLRVANYDIHSQYKYLSIYKKHIIPFLGVYPRNDRERWLSILTRYGTPFELSLNCGNSVVRFTYEPINAATATPKDPFNTHAIWESLDRLIQLDKSVDLEWFRHFKRDLTLNTEESTALANSDVVAGQIRTQNKLALDLKGGRFMAKVYIYPALKSVATGKSIQQLIFESVRRLPPHQLSRIEAPLSVLEEYLQSRGPATTATPRLFSCDLVNPVKARIKIYLIERMVSLESMRDMWTLGDRRTDPAALTGWSMVEELWELLQIPPGLRSYPETYLPLGTVPDELLPTMANYTLHPDDPLPEPQVYFTTFGMDFLAVANALTTFFERRGWKDMAASYTNSMLSY